jgi:hypothetical protein
MIKAESLVNEIERKVSLKPIGFFRIVANKRSKTIPVVSLYITMLLGRHDPFVDGKIFL